MKNLKKLAAKLDDHGRDGDTLVAHINPREAALLKALGGRGTVNPKTGLLEFSDQGVGESFGGGGAETGFGSFGDGVTAGNIGGDYVSDGNSGQIADLSQRDQAQIYDGGLSAGPNEAALGSAARGAFGNRGVFGGVIGGIADRVGRAIDNPGATLTNMALGAVVGPAYSIANEVYGGITGKDFGRGIVGGIADATGYNGTAAPAGQVAGGERSGGPKGDGGPLSGSESGGGFASGDGGGISRGNMALANALMGEPQSGSPANPFGRQTFGALVNSYDPNGRQYVTPWAYRG